MQIKTLAALAAVTGTLGLAGCGSDTTIDAGSGAATSEAGATKAAGNGFDRAFVAGMVPHHRSAVEMAEMAEGRAKSAYVKRLAKNIIDTQNAEIRAMRTEDAALARAGVRTGSLGMDHSMMGMDMDMDELMSSAAFDRTFMQMMTVHHKGAIAMAKVELDKGTDPELRTLAKAIIGAQRAEITQMAAQLDKAA